MWQVQVYIVDVGEWYGWAHTDYDMSDKKDAMRAERIAQKYGWKTRVVKVRK